MQDEPDVSFLDTLTALRGEMPDWKKDWRVDPVSEMRAPAFKPGLGGRAQWRPDGDFSVFCGGFAVGAGADELERYEADDHENRRGRKD